MQDTNAQETTRIGTGLITGMITWVYCEDLEQTATFYHNTLGLPLWRDAGAAQIYQTGPNAYIGVCRAFEDRVVQPAGGMITLLHDDVDGCYQALRAKNIPCRGAPTRIEAFGIYSFFCEDPNGYQIEIQTFL